MTKEMTHPARAEGESSRMTATPHAPSGSGATAPPAADRALQGRYQIVSQRGAGRDGVAFEAVDGQSGEVVDLHRLVSAAADPERKDNLFRRLRLLQAFRHPSVFSVRELSLDTDPPFVCLEARRGQSVSEIDADSTRHLSPLERLRFAVQVCDVVTAAHRLGLVHGCLSLEAVFVDFDRVRLDFSGLETLSTVVVGTAVDLADDIPALATVIDGLLSPAAVSDSLNALSARQHAALRQLIRMASGEEPSQRPLAQEFLELLRGLNELADTEANQPSADLDQTSEASSTSPSMLVENTPDTEAATVEQVVSHDNDLDSTDELDATQSAPDLSLAADVSISVAGRQPPEAGAQLGRYQIVKKIGEGGMGSVFKATDIGDGRVVAIKTLNAASTVRANALIRFQKEGRMLAAVNNPFVTNLIEVNEDDGLHYIVLEFVDGIDVKQVLQQLSPLPERQAIAIAADVARALVDAHERGIVHRDIKPENILLGGDPLQFVHEGGGSSVDELAEPLRCKLSDFGIARYVDSSESLAVTQAGAILGTPRYMSPEQCKGQGDVVPQSDVYSLGITLFELLTGTLPFQADDPVKLVAMHCFDAAPAVTRENPRVSDAVAAIVAKALAKRPEDRFTDAAHILRELDQLLRGQPSDIQVHPVVPEFDPSKHVHVDLQWDLKSSPEELWPFVANTDRLNRAIGLPSVEYRTEADPEKGIRRFGSFSMLGMSISWEEHPFEWIEGKRMGVVRDFERGPFKSFTNIVELERLATGGTRLTHRIMIAPAGFVGRMLAKIDAGKRAPKSLEKVYRRVDETLQNRKKNRVYADPFEEASTLPRLVRRRIEQRVQQLVDEGVSAELASQLGEFIESAPAQGVAKIQPYALADQLYVDQQELLDACLLACNTGLLTLQWDVLCPTCRVAADTKSTLKQLQAHTFCEACNVDFDSDVASSVELIFQAHPDLREVSTGKYCIGGPSHTPHVVAQLRVEPEERVEIELALPVGEYLIRGPNLPQSVTIRVQPTGPSQHDLHLDADLDIRQVPLLRAGGQLLRVSHGFDMVQVIRLERTISRQDVVTAAQASVLPMFRKLFPGEVFEQGQLISAEHVTLLVTAIDNIDELYERLGDADAYTIVQQHIQDMDREISQRRGAVVKIVGEGLVAAFDEVADAVATAFHLQDFMANLQIVAGALLPSSEKTGDAGAMRVRLDVGVHSGPAIVTTVNDRLDYFGATARVAAALPEHAEGGVLLTEPVFADPVVAEQLQGHEFSSQLRSIDLPGRPQQLVQMFV